VPRPGLSAVNQITHVLLLACSVEAENLFGKRPLVLQVRNGDHHLTHSFGLPGMV